DPVHEVVTHGALAFDDVGFSYPGAEHAVLCDISFATAPGQTTAIVGSTGAGKTTLVNLILRLFDSTEGQVSVGGVHVRDLDPYTKDAAVVIVAQRVSTISNADNILVLEDGAVIGRGTHDELIRDCPTYAEIVQSQIGEKSAAA